jgi:hypothetical protein
MTYTAGALEDVSPFGGRSLSFGNYRRVLFGGGVVVLGTVAAGWVIVTSLTVATSWMAASFHGANPAIQTRPPIMAPEAMALANPYGTLAREFFGSVRVVDVPESASAVVAASAPDPLFDPEWAHALAQTFAPTGSASVLSDRSFQSAAAVLSSPLLSPPAVQAKNPPDSQATRDIARAPDVTREAELTPPADPAPELPYKRTVEKQDTASPPAGPAAPPVAAAPPSPPASGPFSFLAKLFAGPQADTNSNLLPDRASRTAIYDIAAHTVYLPNGNKLEAHSGMGQMLDDPRYVNAKDRGATPPHVYDLVLRESLFHGVQAIRLNPVGDGNMFGRDGILAHPYMLGPNGQSNGCVSFRDYHEFLRAFQNGEVDRLVVVPRLGDKPSQSVRTRHKRPDRYALNNRTL